MRRATILVSAMVGAFAAIAQSQALADDAALRALPRAFADAWNKHDGHELAKIMAEDVDFVNVGALWLRGRADFETYHTRLLAGGQRESNLTALETAVRFLRPDFAIVHWSWQLDGDRNPDGSARPRSTRFGLMTMVAEKRDGNWLVIAAQNANGSDVDRSADPRTQGIAPPIAVPRNGSNQ